MLPIVNIQLLKLFYANYNIDPKTFPNSKCYEVKNKFCNVDQVCQKDEIFVYIFSTCSRLIKIK